MQTLKIVIPGQPVIKKNSTGKLWFYTDKKTGNKIPLPKPRTYYGKSYQKWAKRAVETLTVWKSKHSELNFPLGQDGTTFVVSILCFIDHSYKVDLSNLVEAAQDVLTGNAGKALFDKIRQKDGKKYKEKFDHFKYQVLSDDNFKVIKSLGASTIMIDPINPRTEIYISEFNLKLWSKMWKLLHPDVSIKYESEDKEQIDLDLGNLFEES